MEVTDDDVVIKGSELHKYLEEQGLSDYEISENNILSHSSLQVCEATEQKHCTILKYFRMPSQKEPRCLLKEIKLILKSGLLFPEDCHMVENLIPTLEENKEENCTWLKNFTIHSTILGGTLLMWYRQIVPLIVPAVISCCSAYVCLLKLLHVHYDLQREKIIQEMLVSQLNFSMLLNKIMKTLKELEIFERGLTLTALTHSKMNEDSVLLLSIKQWCAVPQLRKALASSSLDVIKLLKEGTKQMVLRFPIGLSCDSQFNYIAFLPGKEGGIDDLLSNESSRKWTITDLQKLHDIFLLLQSEFLRRLCLCFSEDLCPLFFTRMSEILSTCEALNKKILSVNGILTKEYRSYKYYKGEKKNKNMGNLQTKPWQYSDIYANTHNVFLHLQCLLHESEKLEELLQDLHLERESGITEVHFLEELQKSVSFIDKHLDLCKNGVNDIFVQIKTLLNKYENISDFKNSITEDKPLQPMQNMIPILVGHSDWDPPGEDEVFEEVISCESDRGKCDSGMIADDITETKTRKLFSQKVLSELKGALVAKREEWRAREENALRKKLLKDGVLSDFKVDSDQYTLPDKLHFCAEETNAGEVEALGLNNKILAEKLEFEGKHCLTMGSKETLNKFNKTVLSSCSEVCPSNPFETVPDIEKPVKTFLAEAPKAISATFLKEDLFCADSDGET